MDFKSHYGQQEIAVQQNDEFIRKNEDNRITKTYNDCIDNLIRDIPNLLDMYKSDPPQLYSEVSINGEEHICWVLAVKTNHRSPCNIIFLLTDGRIAYTDNGSVRSGHYTLEEIVVNGKIFKKKKYVGVKFSSIKFKLFIELKHINSYSEFVNSDKIDLLNLLVSACEKIDLELKELENKKIEAKRPVQEKVNKKNNNLRVFGKFVGGVIDGAMFALTTLLWIPVIWIVETFVLFFLMVIVEAIGINITAHLTFFQVLYLTAAIAVAGSFLSGFYQGYNNKT